MGSQCNVWSAELTWSRTPLDSQPLVILILKILTGPAKTLRTHEVLWAVSPAIHINCNDNIPKGFEENVSTGQQTASKH